MKTYCTFLQSQLKEDIEIQAWWREVQSEGHPDKVEGWPKLETVTDLRDILVTIAFTGSAHHAAVNFGAPKFYFDSWQQNHRS